MPAASAAPAVRASRYGETASRRSRNRLLLVLGAAFIAVVMILWAVWVGLGGSSGTLDASSGANQVVDAKHVDVSVTVHAPVGTDVSCAVQAQNISFTPVGYAVVHLGKLKTSTVDFTKRLVTFEPAVAGSLDSCWVN